MKLLKRLTSERGYLLVENLVTLIILTIILLVIYPLLSQWFVVREKAKEEVELSRVLYETSFEQSGDIRENPTFRIQKTSTSIFIKSANQEIGVDIYEKHFKK